MVHSYPGCRRIRDDNEPIFKEWFNHRFKGEASGFIKDPLFEYFTSLTYCMQWKHFPDGFELPTRLSVAAADCILAITEALTKIQLGTGMTSERVRASRPNESNKPVSILGERQGEPENVSNNIEMGLLLWEHLGEIIILVQKLHCWSGKSRPLHAKGVWGVLKWLQGIKTLYGRFSDEAGFNPLKTGVLLLSSCWKHYSMLLRLEHREFLRHCNKLVDQYISGMQLCPDGGAKESVEHKDISIETRKFFLNCLALLLGRLDSKKLATIIAEDGVRISDALLSQFHCADEDVTDVVVCIFKLAIFKMTDGGVGNPTEMEAVLPSFLQMLDECDDAARAAVVLIAEYCSTSKDSWCLQEVLKRFASGNVAQRRNAIDIISEFICISSDPAKGLSISFLQDIANHLLDCLTDDDSVIRTQAGNLLPLIDPSLVLPALVRLISSSNDSTNTAATNAFVGVLRNHNQSFEVISLLLDCLSSFSQSQDHCKASGGIMKGAPKLDTDQVLRLVPDWSKTVQDWTPLIGPLIDKMLLESTNATLIKFLSYISEHLADAADLVLGRVLLQAKAQKDIDGSALSRMDGKSHVNSDLVSSPQMLFDRLCPLLILRLLPLRVFNDLHSAIMYGQLLDQDITQGYEFIDIGNYECIAAFLFNRTFCQFEFDDVRKLAAELCGRIHPQVLFPVAFTQLECAAEIKDTLKIKACLFSICSSLTIRGRDSVSHPFTAKIQRVLKRILLWPSVDGDEVSKAQHGCIDCLALMICAELQVLKSLQESAFEQSPITTEAYAALTPQTAGDSTSGSSVLSFVIDRLTNGKLETELPSEVSKNSASRMTTSFRLCMANVLISACQKISESGKETFVQKTLPHLIQSIKVMEDAEIRAAGIQVLFSSVYHLKLANLPYASALLKLSLKSIRGESVEERVAGAKLMASLMASEDVVVESISEGLLEARSVLSRASTSDPSLELRRLCHTLLACLTSR
ncbi:hypothetical protein Nepgr_010019 [Nepenthes gracilis]|uniref:ARM repeat superfamily protein n=1 Tax=Nepenthes gracilis TaxID=150966 RepID=A0AAD3SCH5_NEPGR|nr:hypothetical protein Nepgr_010019 [Nepenthes gracilis]